MASVVLLMFSPDALAIFSIRFWVASVVSKTFFFGAFVLGMALCYPIRNNLANKKLLADEHFFVYDAGTMKITPSTRAAIRLGLRDKGLKNVDLTNHLNRPRNYATKLFNGQMKTIDEDEAGEISKFLGIKLMRVTERGIMSDAAVRLSRLMDSDPALADVFTRLVNYLEGETTTDAPRVTRVRRAAKKSKRA